MLSLAQAEQKLDLYQKPNNSTYEYHLENLNRYPNSTPCIIVDRGRIGSDVILRVSYCCVKIEDNY